jgi:ubiquinone/menaquinone biosynthesis C-methylase UbiE
MDEETLKSIAAQLRKPHGEYALQVGEKMNEGNLHINLNTIEALKLKANDNILEIGMGNGFFVKNILSVAGSIQYSGCDFSEAMIAAAAELNKSFIENGRAEFHLGNADKLPFKDETFDKIFTINTIYFWDNPALVFSELRRVLKPGGELFIAIRPRSVMQHYPFVKYGFNMFSKEELENSVAENNFKVKATLEIEEPEQEIGGEKIPVKSLIVCGEKE